MSSKGGGERGAEVRSSGTVKEKLSHMYIKQQPLKGFASKGQVCVLFFTICERKQV
jgi:hypothetical protein